MKKIEVAIATLLVKKVYYLTYLFPIKKNKISIVSYFNSELGLEFSKLNDLLEAENFLLVYELSKFKGNAKGKFKYLLSLIKQTYLFNTSKIIILDGNSFVYSTIKVKKQVKTIQLWHASGAIKKFGNLTNRVYEIKGYDSLIVSSNYFKNIFANALNTKIENTHALGISKTDYLFDEKYLNQRKTYFFEKYPHLKNKKIVLYAPTFRGQGISDMTTTSDIGLLNNYLDDYYHLIAHLHPLSSKYDLNDKNNFVNFYNEDLYTLLIISNIVISDYSALVFDASLLNKKVLLYLFDLKQYSDNRGLCLNIDELAFEKCYNIKELSTSIINCEINVDNKQINQKYLDALDGYSSEKILNHIKEMMGVI